MSTYAIGDVQGCLNDLMALLAHVHFDPSGDVLWFTGDLVNRGADSLGVLRFVRQLGASAKLVLGNHDLHLIASYYHPNHRRINDTLNDIYAADDAASLIEWLCGIPLIYQDTQLNCVMTHAGMPPMWSLDEACQYSAEVQMLLQGDERDAFLNVLYGNFPACWDNALTGFDRYRAMINYFTRMRLCDQRGCLDFSYKGDLASLPANLFPWFALPTQLDKQYSLIFGHWAALNGHCPVEQWYALDTGCVWGGHLTALRLEDKQRFQVRASVMK